MVKEKTLKQLGYEVMNIDSLVKAEWNYKEEDKEKSENLAANMKRNGQVENIIVRKLKTGFFEVVNGNHRLDVMNKLGITNVVVCNRGGISLAEAQRLAVETNETRFNTDNLRLAEIIKEMTLEFKDEELLKTLPYNEQELNNFKELLEFDWEQYNEDETLNFDHPDEFTMNINLNISPETYKSWEQLKERMKRITGYDNESKVFEFAVIETLNIPLEE